MVEEHQTQLFRRIQYLERALALNKPDYLRNKGQYDAVIEVLNTMVSNREITTYLGIDSIYYYLIEKIEEGKSDLHKYAREIKEFLDS